MLSSDPTRFTGMPPRLWQYRDNPPRLRPFFGGPEFFLPRDDWFVVGETVATAENTGVLPNKPRQVWTGDLTTTTAGDVIENLTIYGRLFPLADNVKVRNVEVVGTGTIGPAYIECRNAYVGREFTDVTVRSEVASLNWTAGIRGNDYTLLRGNISGAIDALKADARGVSADAPSNVKILGSYVHGLSYISPDPSQPSDNATHNDCIQITSGQNIEIIGNTIISDLGMVTVNSGGHSDNGEYGQGVTLTPTNGPIRHVKVTHNLFGDGVHSIIAEGSAANFEDVTVEFNKFLRTVRPSPDEPNPGTQIRPITTRAGFFNNFPTTSGPDINGNVWADTGEPVDVFLRGA